MQENFQRNGCPARHIRVKRAIIQPLSEQSQRLRWIDPAVV
jgi:hypothetical protein